MAMAFFISRFHNGQRLFLLLKTIKMSLIADRFFSLSFVLGYGWRLEVRLEKFSTEVGGRWLVADSRWLVVGEGLVFCGLQKKFVLDETFSRMLR